MNAVIVTGPQESGKTLAASALATRFGCNRVVEDWWPGEPLTPGALHLTHEPVIRPVFCGAQVYDIEEVRP